MKKFSNIASKRNRFIASLALAAMSVTQVLCSDDFFSVAQKAGESMAKDVTATYVSFFWPLFIIGVIAYALVPSKVKPLVGGFCLVLIGARVLVGLQEQTEGTTDHIIEWFGGKAQNTSYMQNIKQYISA